MIKWILVACSLITFDLSAQRFDLGSWNIFNVKYTINDKWSLVGETQLRSLKFYDHFHYYEYKGSIQYRVQKNVTLGLGSGSYQTYREGGDFVLPKNNDEFRIWPSITVHQTLSAIKLEQRLRSEFRFTSNGYRSRFRYRVGFSYEWGKVDKGYKPYQITTNSELFFTDKEPFFERIRTVCTFNFKPNQVTTLQVGYLHQFDYRINDETGRDFLVVGYFLDIRRK
jgi:hypothetical protein